MSRSDKLPLLSKAHKDLIQHISKSNIFQHINDNISIVNLDNENSNIHRLFQGIGNSLYIIVSGV